MTSRGLRGRLARWLRFAVRHQVPVGGFGPARPTDARACSGAPSVGLLSCHLVSGGYGDQVVTHVERALDRRGHVLGPLDAVDPGAPAVVVVHGGSRTRPVSLGRDVLVGRDVALVAYGSAVGADPAPLDEVRAALSARGARVLELAALLDVDGLHHPALACRPTVPSGADDPRASRDPFGLVSLELVLEALLRAGAATRGNAGDPGRRLPVPPTGEDGDPDPA